MAVPAVGHAGTEKGAAVQLQGLDGKPVSLAPAPGDVLLVHFFATWCPDCGPELDALSNVVPACKGSPVRVVAVDVGEAPDEVRDFLGEHAVDLEVMRDPEGHAWRSAAFRGLPANLIWRAGLERRAEIGSKTEAEWRKALTALGCKAASESPAEATGAEPSPEVPTPPTPEEAPPGGS